MKTECPQNALGTDCSTNTGESTNVPSVVIVAQHLGVTSEVWLWRQIVGFDRIIPTVLTWEYKNQRKFPLNGTPMRVMTSDPTPYNGRRRWLSRVQNLSGRNFFGTVGKESRELRQWFSKQNPAAILCHFGHVALRILPVANDLGIPLVAHFHGMDLSSMLKNRWYRWSLDRHLCSFTGVVVVGSRQQQWMLDQGVDPERVHLIPCGVPTDEFTPPSDRPEDPLRFVAVSRLVAWKGVDLTIRAFARAASGLPRALLVIIGDGPDCGELETLAAGLGLADRVIFRGAQLPAIVRQELERSHVFVQHSLDLNGWYEGFGVSLAEAAAMGLPVVASRCGGIMDQVVDGQTGFIVDQHDVDGMAKAMQRLGRDSQLRHRFGQDGRRRMVREFDATSQVRKLEGVLRRLATVRSGVSTS